MEQSSKGTWLVNSVVAAAGMVVASALALALAPVIGPGSSQYSQPVQSVIAPSPLTQKSTQVY